MDYSKYKSPIEIAFDKVSYEVENNIYNAVQKYNINVDKKELEKALRYDRQQYEAGYNAAMDKQKNKMIQVKAKVLELIDLLYDFDIIEHSVFAEELEKRVDKERGLKNGS